MRLKHARDNKGIRDMGPDDIREAGESVATAIADAAADAAEAVREAGERVRAMANQGANGLREVGESVREAPAKSARAAADAKEAVATRAQSGADVVRSHRGKLLAVTAAAVSALIASVIRALKHRSRSNPA